MRRRVLAVLVGSACLTLSTACNQSGEQESDSGPGTAVEETPEASTADGSEDRSSGSPAVPRPTETVRFFDAERMNADVRRVVTRDYGLRRVQDVTCPRNEPVEVDASFVCSVELADGEREVTITVETGQGRYRVGAPE